MIILENHLHFKSVTIKINTAAASPHESFYGLKKKKKKDCTGNHGRGGKNKEMRSCFCQHFVGFSDNITGFANRYLSKRLLWDSSDMLHFQAEMKTDFERLNNRAEV